MNKIIKPKVYISYAWILELQQDGQYRKFPDKRARELAEKLREHDIDVRLDMFFFENLYGFKKPTKKDSDNLNDPWMTWVGEQIKESDAVIMFCTQEYIWSDESKGGKYGDWHKWHTLSYDEKVILQNDLETKKSGVWWDWHHIAEELESNASNSAKFIPVGLAPYYSFDIPRFIYGATYYNLNVEEQFKGLLQSIKKQFRIKNPRQGVFVSYAHKDEQKWLGKFLNYLEPLKDEGIDIWVDKNIKTGEKWHEVIQNSLSNAKVVIFLVTPAFIKSDYITNHELSIAIRDAQEEGARIFWILLESCDFNATELANFQSAYPVKQPLSEFSDIELESAFEKIVSNLKLTIMD